MSSLQPLRRSIVVPLSQQKAFDLFFRRMHEWWPLATRSVWLDNAVSCHVEVHVDGRLYERSRDGKEATWGKFSVVDEPRRAVFSWHPGYTDANATEIELRFEPEGDTTRVDLEHRHWERLGERASFVRGLFEGGWNGVLARFDALARGTSDLPPVQGPGCIAPDAPARR